MLDQAHEQNNACVNGDGGRVGLLDHPCALGCWMVTTPEVERVIMEFEANMHPSSGETRHHYTTPSAQKMFAKDLRSNVAVMKELEDPLEGDSLNLLVLGTKEIVDPAVNETVRTAKLIGRGLTS